MERIPVFTVGDLLLVTIQADVRDRLFEGLQADLGVKIRDSSARGVLIDISALEVLDVFMARTLERLASFTRLLGAETVLVGMRPAVALTLLELGRTLDCVTTAVSVESGMSRLRGRQPPAAGDEDGDADGREAEPSEEEVGDAGRAGAPED